PRAPARSRRPGIHPRGGEPRPSPRIRAALAVRLGRLRLPGRDPEGEPAQPLRRIRGGAELLPSGGPRALLPGPVARGRLRSAGLSPVQLRRSDRRDGAHAGGLLADGWLERRGTGVLNLGHALITPGDTV